MIKKILDSLLNIVLGTSAGVLIILLIISFYEENFSQWAQDRKVRAIYAQIIANTGQIQDTMPLVISEELVDNAYNDGEKIVIYRGLINHAHSWDEVALVLAHEVAHGMLWHLKMNAEGFTAYQISVLEGNADKMGAVYMMKAGYDVCKGRELFKYWREEKGNALGQSHPDFSYRYDELNINCK